MSVSLAVRLFWLWAFSSPKIGHFVIQNDTPYNFRLVKQDSIQMGKWTFPEIIAAHSSEEVEVQFNSGSAQGYAVYELTGLGLTFAVKAVHTAGDSKEAADIYVIFMNFSNLGTKTLRGFWSKDVRKSGKSTFYLRGQLGNFTVEEDVTLMSALRNS